MAVTVADLMVRFAADTANADAGFSHVDQQIGRFQAANNAAFSSLQGVGTAALGVVGGGLLAIGGGMAATAVSGLSLNSTMENVTAQLNAFTKDGAKSAEILEMIRVRAAKTPFEFNEMAAAAAGLLPASKASGQGLESLIEKAEILAASNPAEGLEGAAFALREAVSGDFTSIIERFNLPRAYINQLKAEGVPALEIVSRAMKEVGFDTDLVSNLAETAAGRWSTFKDTFQTFAATMTQPIFDRFSAGLGSVNSWLEANAPLLSHAADLVGKSLGAALDAVGSRMPSLESMLGGMVSGFVNVVEIVSGVAQVFSEFASSGELLSAAEFGIGEGAAEAADRIVDFALAIYDGISAVAAFVAPIVRAISSFVSWKDVLTALGLSIAAVVVPAIAAFVAAWTPVIATFAVVVAAVAALRTAWENDFLGIRTIVLSLTTAITNLVTGSDFTAFVSRVWDAFSSIGQAIGDFFSGDISAGGLASAVASGFSQIVGVLGAFFGGGDWSGFLEAIRWADFISVLTWDNFVAALDWLAYVGSFLWTDYIAPLLWDGLVAVLDWAQWLTTLDWTTIITTVIDWATWIPALAWTGFVTVLEWGAYLVAIAWDAFIGVLDWATTVGDGITWSDFVAALDWAGYIVSFTWDSFVTKLEWTGFMSKMESWGDYISAIDWTKVITTTLSWGLYVVALTWNTFVKVIEWADWLVSLKWDDYADALKWGDYAKSFDWDSYIDPVAWSDWIDSALSWADYVLSLVWGDFISKLDWPDVSFSWSTFVSKLSWPSISWPGWSSFIPSFPGWPDVSGLLSGLLPGGGGEEEKSRLLDRLSGSGAGVMLSQEFSSLQSKISGVINGALNDIGGIDLNAILPEQGIGEGAKALADIAVNGFGSQWVYFFRDKFPAIFNELQSAGGNVKASAAQILKDFQTGMRPDLLDKNKAKEIVRRMLLGEQRTGELVSQIASELASELNIPMEQVREAAAGALGGGSAINLNSLLPADNTLSEGANKLADVMVNGYNSKWVSYFQREFPNLFQTLTSAGSNIKASAAQLLKDFQDGLHPELIDREKAKEMIRRLITGGQNTKALIAEISAELAAEMGRPLEEIQQAAQSVLSNGGFTFDNSMLTNSLSTAKDKIGDLVDWLGNLTIPNPLDALILPEWMRDEGKGDGGTARLALRTPDNGGGLDVATLAAAIAEAMRGQPLVVNLAFQATIAGPADAESVSYDMARRISDIIQRRSI